jgi:hypothetical protein
VQTHSQTGDGTIPQNTGPSPEFVRYLGGGPVRRALLAFALSSLVFGTLAALTIRLLRVPAPSTVFAGSVPRLRDLLEARKLTKGTRALVPSTLDREPIDERTARVLFPQLESRRYHYDPLAYFRPGRQRSDWLVWDEHPEGGWFVNTNSAGMRGVVEIRSERPTLRLVVVGDSHTFGKCGDHETFAHLLETALRRARQGDSVEVLNASAGGYDPWNYLGVIENCLPLEPDIVVVVLYGGNDFKGCMAVERYFHRRGAPRVPEHGPADLERFEDLGTAAFAQEVAQVLYFRANPEDEPIAAATVKAIAVEAQQECGERGAQLLCVYLPSPATVQADFFLPLLAPILAACDTRPSELEITDRLADQWLGDLRKIGIPELDLRPALGAAKAPCYWKRDLHLNVDGHRLVADVLEPSVLALLE